MYDRYGIGIAGIVDDTLGLLGPRGLDQKGPCGDVVEPTILAQEAMDTIRRSADPHGFPDEKAGEETKKRNPQEATDFGFAIPFQGT